MASLSIDSAGRSRLQFVDHLDGKRKTIYLGKITPKAADSIKTHVEAIIDHRREGAPHTGALVRWIAALSDELAGKLAAVGLLEPRDKPDAKESVTLADFIPIYLDGKPHLKKSARIACQTSLRSAIAALGSDMILRDVDERMAASMINGMNAAGYAKATVSKAIVALRAMFTVATRQGLADRNPFDFVKAGSQVNNERKVFIEADKVRTLIDALPNNEWKLLVALARWGGLRTPSEPFALRWDHVLWDKNRLIVPTPKLEHLPGRGTRIIPIFPEVQPYLDAAWDEVGEDGAVYIFTRLRKLTGISTLLRKRIVRAGLIPWPRTWHNLRASRSTELADRFPGHVAAAWLGHSNEIADKAYRSVLDSHYDDALNTTQKTTQYGAELSELERTGLPTGNAKTPENVGFPGVSRKASMTLMGFEPRGNLSGNTANSARDDAESDALSVDPALRAVFEAITNLTPEQRAALAGMLSGEPHQPGESP